ncbi:MG284/MPN403 family protein [Mycoplasmopsis adleri]|uniref:MG284/MPN403 family protein n=1 Tax=Mycoplasmopsis adleri TaxID=51362 RepID=UPI0038733E0E
MILEQFARLIDTYEISDLEKYRAVEAICRLEKASARINAKEGFKSRSSSSSLLDNQPFHKENIFLSDKFKNILECLSDDSKHIIFMEFIKPKHNFWYEDFYSKTTYYKKRKKAVNEFLSYYINYSL